MNVSKLAEYLGSHVGQLLRIQPFCRWEAKRSFDSSLPESQIWYEFDGHGVEIICDGVDCIQTIFLRGGDGEALADVPFSLTRAAVRRLYGRPSKSGGPVSVPGLGARGPWDRFRLSESSVHFHYRVDRDEIEMITLMCPSSVPGRATSE